jgi:septum formation protein
MSTLWLDTAPLVLASASRIRADVLRAAGIPIEIVPADVDERALEAPLLAAGVAPAAIARALAAAKAEAVSELMPGRLVLGADQVLALGNERFTKPADAAAARAQLRRLSGQTHVLHSAAALARDGTILDAMDAEAHLQMRALTPEGLDRYLAAAGDVVLSSVGAYQLEALGIHLFDRIEGDHFTVLGLPLLPLLASLRAMGVVAE